MLWFIKMANRGFHSLADSIERRNKLIRNSRYLKHQLDILELLIRSNQYHIKELTKKSFTEQLLFDLKYFIKYYFTLTIVYFSVRDRVNKYLQKNVPPERVLDNIKLPSIGIFEFTF